jgi:PAS domain S-box-containing protein
MPSTIDLAARLSAIVAAQQEILAAVTDPAAVMNAAVRQTREITEGDGAVIEMADGDELVYRAASGSASNRVGLRLAIDNSLSGLAVRQRTVLRCDDADSDPRVDGAACRALGIRSMIIAPLLSDDEAIGALKTFSGRPKEFDDLDAYTVQILAGMTSAALMHANEYRERLASEERYRMLFERNVAGVFRTTRDGRILDCNDAFVRYLGYSSKEELLGRQTWDLYRQRSDRETLLATLDRNQSLTNHRLRLKRKDGSDVTGVVNVSFIPAEEGETQLLGTLVEE